MTSCFYRLLYKLKKKTLKDKLKPTPKPKIQETENTDTMNKFRILEEMETESCPQLTKPKTKKKK